MWLCAKIRLWCKKSPLNSAGVHPNRLVVSTKTNPELIINSRKINYYEISGYFELTS